MDINRERIEAEIQKANARINLFRDELEQFQVSAKQTEAKLLQAMGVRLAWQMLAKELELPVPRKKKPDGK